MIIELSILLARVWPLVLLKNKQQIVRFKRSKVTRSDWAKILILIPQHLSGHFQNWVFKLSVYSMIYWFISLFIFLEVIMWKSWLDWVNFHLQ